MNLPKNGERLQKVLANTGIASRRVIEQMIKNQCIEVNGKIASLGMRIQGNEIVLVKGKKINLEQNEVCKVIAYHKSEGEICTRSDPENRTTVFERLPELSTGRWIQIGRLDLQTSGLILFTNKGELAHQLMHPSSQIEREYIVRVFGEVSNEQKKRMRNGVQLADGQAKFTDIVDMGKKGKNGWFCVCLTEGRNREVRRLWKSQGLVVNRLKRVRYGSYILPDKLAKGKYCLLTKKEIKQLYGLI